MLVFCLGEVFVTLHNALYTNQVLYNASMQMRMICEAFHIDL